MSDNNLDIRARLTGEDRLSPTVVKLLAKIKSLEEQMERFGKKAKASITDIPMEDYVKKINASGKAINGLTKKHMDWAKANNVANDKAGLSWGLLTNEIIRLQKEHEKMMKLTGRGSKKKQKDAQDELNLQYKNAAAFKYLYNKTADDRISLQRRTNQEISNLEATHLRNEQLRQRRHFTNLARMRRDAMDSVRSMSRIGNRAAPYAAATAGATGYGAVSAFRTRMKADTAETNLRMFGEMSQDEVRKMRQSYGNAAAIKYGLSPDKMIDAYTEVIKAGVPKELAQGVTDTIMKAGAGLDIDLRETTKFATRVATLTQDMSKLDPAKLKSVLNAVAIANIDTAADSNEIIAANRKAAGVLVNKNFKAEDLSAFTSIGVSAGLQSGKAGGAIQFMYNELAGAKNAKGKRANDLGALGNMLGMGGRGDMSRKILANPADTMMAIFGKIDRMNPQDAQKALNLLGMREWRDELAVFVKEYTNLSKVLADIRDPKNALKLDEINDKKLKSLAGRWKSLVAAMTLVWEATGAGLEKAFGEIQDFFVGYLGKFDTSKISTIVEGFTDGIVQGLGFDNWTEMLKSTFGDANDLDGKGWAEKVRLFTKGFVSEMVKLWNVFSTMFHSAAAAFSGTDPEAMGRFTGHLVELAVALKSIGALAETMVTVIHFFEGLAAILTVLKASPVLQFIAKYAGGPGSVAAVGGMTTNQEDDELNNGAAKWKELRSKYGQGTIDAARKKYQPWYQFGNGYAGENEQWIKKYLEEQKKAQDPNYKKTSSIGATDFSSRGRTSDLAENLNKFTGKVELAAFRNGSGGLQYAALGGGSGRGLSSSGGGGGGFSGGLIGGVPSLLKSTPGEALPSFGVGRSGSILRHGGVGALTGGNKVPSIGAAPGGIADMSVGKGLSGNSFLAARRARFAEEIKNDPTLRMHLAAMQMTEGASRGGTIESLMNRADMEGKTLRQMLGYNADGTQSHDKRGRRNSFYGPIRRGELEPAIAKLQRNPKLFGQYDSLTNGALAGSHVIGGYTDQGLPTDPNGSRRTGIPGLHLRDPRTGKQDGNEFTDWVGPGGRNKAIRFRQFLDQGIAGTPDSPITNVPSPTDMIKNVPSPTAARPGAGAGDIRSNSGNVAIHINGSSHDPEALATLVQRRIDESMQWRTHDTASEYT
jgi:TP901 family phage tail tape measure protein